jgi:plastocyanin
VKLRIRDMVVVAACAAAVLVPALAYGDAAPDASFTAEDNVWHVTGSAATQVTIAPGDTVAFGYPTGASYHDVKFDSGEPSSCSGLPAYPSPHGWSGTCRFDTAGTYTFHCEAHPDTMMGTVRVVKPAPTPTATPTPPPAPGSTPAPGATPTPTPTPTPGTPATQTTLKGAVAIAAHQKGTRVRGRVMVRRQGSRLEVSVWVPRSALPGGKGKTLIRIGRSLTAATREEKVAFAVAVSAKARTALHRRGKLTVTVNVALTPPGGHKLTHSARATLRAS